jgi:bacteriorhodopsin
MSGSGLNALALGVIIIFGLLVIYIVGGSYMEHHHFAVGHETTIALLFGLLISVTTFVWTGNHEL